MKQSRGDDRCIRLCKRIADKEQAFRTKHADHFAQRLALARKMMQQRIGNHGIEGSVRKGKRTGIAALNSDCALEPRPLDVFPCPSQNRRLRVNTGDGNVRPPGADLDRNPGPADSHVENAKTRSRSRLNTKRCEKFFRKRMRAAIGSRHHSFWDCPHILSSSRRRASRFFRYESTTKKPAMNPTVHVTQIPLPGSRGSPKYQAIAPARPPIPAPRPPMNQAFFG